MQFGRVDGFITVQPDGQRRMTVVLDTGRDLETLRDEHVAAAIDSEAGLLLMDQLVAEALANDLAEEGWEVVGEGDTTHETHNMLDVVARSRTWVVQRKVPK